MSVQSRVATPAITTTTAVAAPAVGFSKVSLQTSPGMMGIGGSTAVTFDPGTPSTSPKYVVTANFQDNPPSSGVLDAARGAQLQETVQAFLASNPPAVQGDPKVLRVDGIEDRINIVLGGEQKTFEVYTGGASPATSALIDALQAARDAAIPPNG